MPPKKFLGKHSVVSVESVALNTYLIQIAAAEIAAGAQPGQFINVLVPHCGEILWRRPFSIHRVDRRMHTVDILFNAIGRGTQTLTQLRPGDLVDILGPLGNSFTFPDSLKEAIFVAGGLGIAPFLFALDEIKTKNFEKTLFYGVGTAKSFCMLDPLERLSRLYLSTNDGTCGNKGLVTDMLEKYLATLPDREGRALYVCGPTAMLRQVKGIAQKYGIEAWVSVETIMACGFGACVGCAVPLVQPDSKGQKYLLACVNGPVFNMEEIALDE